MSLTLEIYLVVSTPLVVTCSVRIHAEILHIAHQSISSNSQVLETCITLLDETNHVRSEVIMGVTIKNTVFWYVTPCSLPTFRWNVLHPLSQQKRKPKKPTASRVTFIKLNDKFYNQRSISSHEL
jgi:hypothetical protein